MQVSNPIVVRVLEEPAETTGVADLLIGALGLTSVMLLAALLLGLTLGAILIGIQRLRAKYGLESLPDRDAMRVTPSSST